MAASDVVVLVHALVGILFVAGLVGRWIVLGLAARATELPAMRTLTAAAGPFERIVIVGSLLVTVFGVSAAFMQGRSILGPLTGGDIDWLFVSVVLFLSILPLVPLVFLPRGKVFEAALANAETEDRVTPELLAAWNDPLVRAAHLYELGAVTVVLILMFARPFGAQRRHPAPVGGARRTPSDVIGEPPSRIRQSSSRRSPASSSRERGRSSRFDAA